MFCEKCRCLMFPKDGKLVCNKCGAEVAPGKKQQVIKHKSTEKEVAFMGELSGTLPTTDDVECPKCGNRSAYWVLRQTRAADEPETRIFRCTKCAHSWREY